MLTKDQVFRCQLSWLGLGLGIRRKYFRSYVLRKYVRSAIVFHINCLSVFCVVFGLSWYVFRNEPVKILIISPFNYYLLNTIDSFQSWFKVRVHQSHLLMSDNSCRRIGGLTRRVVVVGVAVIAPFIFGPSSLLMKWLLPHGKSIYNSDHPKFSAVDPTIKNLSIGSKWWVIRFYRLTYICLFLSHLSILNTIICRPPIFPLSISISSFNTRYYHIMKMIG